MGLRGRKPNLAKHQAIIDKFAQCASMKETAVAFGVTRQRIQQILKKAGIASVERWGADRLRDMAVRCQEVKSIPKVAAEFGVSHNSLYWALKRAGIRIKPLNDPVALFWSHIEKGSDNDCWIWTGTVHRCGYGYAQFRVLPGNNWKPWYAHRLVWYLTHGSVPTADLELRHKCGIRLCCNPAHLCIGTRQDNIRDRSLHKIVGHGSHAVRYFD
jgi:hypothetical protein